MKPACRRRLQSEWRGTARADGRPGSAGRPRAPARWGTGRRPGAPCRVERVSVDRRGRLWRIRNEATREEREDPLDEQARTVPHTEQLHEVIDAPHRPRRKSTEDETTELRELGACLC